MGLLSALQDDPEKLAALRQGLISMGTTMMAGGRQDFGTALGQGVGAGVKTYAEKFEEARKKALAIAPYKAAMTPAKPAVPAVYKAGGQSLPQLGQAQDVAQNMYNLPQGANPYKPPEQDMTGEVLGMPASLMPQGMGIEDMSGGQPGQIEEVAAQPAQAASFDRNKYLEAVIEAGPEHPLFMKAQEMMFEQPKPIVLGKSLIDPKTNKVIATDETWREEKDVARQQRMDEIKMRLEDNRLSREMQAELRRELAGMQAAYQRESLDLRRDALAQGGKPPAGYRYTPDGNLEAVPGGPADIKAGELGDKRAKQRELSIAQASSVLKEIRDAKNLVGYTTAGAGGVLRNLPMTSARDLDAKLTSIKANLGFDRLQQMRDASPTGGALGQVAVQELTALQSTIASLDQLQTPGQLKAALDKIDKHYTNWQKTLQGDTQPAPRQPATTRPKSGVMSPEQILNEELQNALDAGDTKEAEIIRREMRSRKFRETASPRNLPQKKGAIPAGWTVKER